jgi:hypothetical protein
MTVSVTWVNLSFDDIFGQCRDWDLPSVVTHPVDPFDQVLVLPYFRQVLGLIFSSLVSSSLVCVVSLQNQVNCIGVQVIDSCFLQFLSSSQLSYYGLVVG